MHIATSYIEWITYLHYLSVESKQDIHVDNKSVQYSAEMVSRAFGYFAGFKIKKCHVNKQNRRSEPKCNEQPTTQRVLYHRNSKNNKLNK